MRPKHARPATKADETPEFQAFWQIWQSCRSAYCGRASARDAFFQHVWWKDADPQDIVDAARWYDANMKPDQKRYKAERWIREGFYEDDAEKWRAYQARISEQQDKSNVVSMQAPKSAFMRQWEAEQAKKTQG